MLDTLAANRECETRVDTLSVAAFIIFVAASASLSGLISALVCVLRNKKRTALRCPHPPPPVGATEAERDAAAMAFLRWCAENNKGPHRRDPL